jgi:hypothetical protein
MLGYKVPKDELDTPVISFKISQKAETTMWSISDVYSTFPIKPCNTTWFDDLNLDDVAALFNASSASKNGPQSWSMDSLQVYASHPVDILVEPVCYYGAVLWPARIVTNPQPPYMSLYLDKNQQLIWDANKPSYWLTDS